VEYDQRNHRLEPLATFSFWVTNTQRPTSGPKSPNLQISNFSPGRARIPSAHSIESRISDSDGGEVIKDIPHSPTAEAIHPIPEDDVILEPSLTGSTAKPDVNCQRPAGDLTAVEDGPLFRASLKAMELKTGNMRARWKKVLKRAESAHEAQFACNAAFTDLIEALRDAASSSDYAVQPAMEHYFDKIAKDILANDRRNTVNLQRLMITPVSNLYNLDIKQADNKKKDFDDVSRDYYTFVGRYLGQRQDSLKEKKKAETDSKYQSRKREFELKKIDYSSYLQDLHGGRKVQKILSNLTEYANAQAQGYLETAKKIETLLPQLEALSSGVREADKEFEIHRSEREERRRAVEKGTTNNQDIESTTISSTPFNGQGTVPQPSNNIATSLSGLGRSISQSMAVMSTSQPSNSGVAALSSSPNNKFKGIRDLEERDYSQLSGPDLPGSTHKKEGLVWALSRPGSHADPRGLNKTAWHK